MHISIDALKAMAGAVARTQEIEYSCDDTYRLLDEFAEAVVQGKEVSALMPLVKHHLEMCSDCREEFEALIRVLRGKENTT